jgi:hypothetical protein
MENAVGILSVDPKIHGGAKGQCEVSRTQVSDVGPSLIGSTQHVLPFHADNKVLRVGQGALSS